MRVDIQKCIKESFVVIGREGSTADGEGFIARLWQEANGHFSEVQHLAGAVHDFTCPKTGKNYMFFPIRKL